VRDKNGKVVYRRRYKSRSFLEGFLNALFADWSGNCGLGAPNLVVGSGTTPPQITDTGLTNQIGNGTGPGQLQYGIDSFTSPIINTNTNTASFSWTKTFNNGSGGNVTVSEVGAYASCGDTTYFILHDLLPSSITLAPNQVLTVVYTITIST
jgi:hypothetical protein